MFKNIYTTLFLSILFSSASAQFNDGFKKLPNGLDVLMIKDVPGKAAQVGDVSKVHITVKVGDTVVFDTKNLPGGEAVEQPINQPKELADLMEGFLLMSPGDIALMRASSDDLFKKGQPRPPFMKDGDFIFWKAEMVELKTQKEIEFEAKAKLAQEKQEIANYIKNQKLANVKETASGMFIQSTKEGTGETVGTGRIAEMNYTGYLLDGTVFDSNVDPKFEHNTPFEFVVGQGMVIKGWDEAIATLKVGEKAKLIIPSGMAYGPQARPGNPKNPKGIPANSPLVFDVEVLSVKIREQLDNRAVEDVIGDIEEAPVMIEE